MRRNNKAQHVDNLETRLQQVREAMAKKRAEWYRLQQEKRTCEATRAITVARINSLN